MASFSVSFLAALVYHPPSRVPRFISESAQDAESDLQVNPAFSLFEAHSCILKLWWGNMCTQVNWEFWTNSNDQCGAVCNVQKEFIKVG